MSVSSFLLSSYPPIVCQVKVLSLSMLTLPPIFLISSIFTYFFLLVYSIDYSLTHMCLLHYILNHWWLYSALKKCVDPFYLVFMFLRVLVSENFTFLFSPSVKPSTSSAVAVIEVTSLSILLILPLFWVPHLCFQPPCMCPHPWIAPWKFKLHVHNLSHNLSSQSSFFSRPP